MTSSLLFGDCANLRQEKINPKNCPESKYIGLEHIAQESLVLLGYGKGSDVDSQKQKFYEGDILFGKLRPYFRKVIIAPFDGICSTDIWVVQPKANIDRDFLFYWMASKEFVDSTSVASEGTRMPRAKWDWVSQFEVPLKNNKEQVAAAKILRLLDKKIAQNAAISETLESIAQSFFKSWFIDFDPVHAKSRGEKPIGMDDETAALFPDSFEDSELGMIPKGWSVRSLDEINGYLNGLALQKFPPISLDESLPVIKIAQLKSGDTSKADRASSKINPKYIIEDGDILFSWSATLEVEHWTSGQGALNQHLFKVTGERVPSWFAYFSTKASLKTFRAIASEKATSMGHIQRGHLSDEKYAIPSEDFIIDNSGIFDSLVNQKILLLTQCRSLAVLRDSLLPKLISGELQIPEELLVS